MSDTVVDNENPNKQGVKRKKKRSANQMAKKLARRRDQGSGSELDSDTYQYMCRIMDVIRNEFAETSFEDKLIFANNVHEQTIGHELDLAKNQVGSLVLDKLMPYINLEAIERLVDAFGSSLRPLCSDRFASHILERIIQVCADRGNRKLNAKIHQGKDEIEVKEKDILKYNEIALKLCRYAINNFEEFVWETYANYVMRTAIQCLGGLIDRVEEQGKKKPTPTFGPRQVVTQEYTDLLIDIANRLLKWGQFIEFGKDELTSILLQTLLYTVKDVDPKLTSSVIKKIKNDCFSESSDENISNIFLNTSSLRLLEVCLSTANEKMYNKLYKKFFAGKLKELSMKEHANFAVQRLMDSCPTKHEFEPIFDEISEHLVEILNQQYAGVLSSLANACLRLQAKQGPFVNLILKCLGCDEPQERQLELVSLLARLITWDQFQSAQKGSRIIPFHLHGSLIIQAMLQFNKPIKVVNSILAMNGEDLATLFCDPKGSRIIDSFMDSKFVGEKSRDKLAKMLKGHWAQFALGVHGSRCLDKIWKYSKSNQRHFIMDELSAIGASLGSTKTGAIISAKLNVPLYARSKKDWEDAEGKEEKTKALFANIIGTNDQKSVNN